MIADAADHAVPQPGVGGQRLHQRVRPEGSSRVTNVQAHVSATDTRRSTATPVTLGRLGSPALEEGHPPPNSGCIKGAFLQSHWRKGAFIPSWFGGGAPSYNPHRAPGRPADLSTWQSRRATVR